MGLERSATEAEVRESYAGFVRVLHPDACQDPALADLRGKREAVFVRLSEAYGTLRDPASRAEYERAFGPPRSRPVRLVPLVTTSAAGGEPAPASPTVPAPPLAATPGPLPATIDERLRPEHILEAAEALFEDGIYWEAIQQLEPMVPRAKEPTLTQARMLLARAYLRNPMWKKRAEGVLQSLLHDNPGHIAACLTLAGLYRDAGLAARARSLYRKVLDIQPGHAEAVGALAMLDPVEKPGPATSGLAGLFKRR
jgi:hypothetical protein